jgi:hypothetical protein
MPATRLTCPACSATLKLGQPVAAGKRIRCPKCKEVITVPEEGQAAAASEADEVAPPPRAPSARSQPGEAVKEKRPSQGKAAALARPADDEEPEEDEENHAAPKRLKSGGKPKQKARKPSLNPWVLWGSIGGGVTVVGLLVLVLVLTGAFGKGGPTGGSRPPGPLVEGPKNNPGPLIPHGPEKKGPTPEPDKGGPQGKPDYTLEAWAFSHEIFHNPKTAPAKYAGKTIEIAGTVIAVRSAPGKAVLEVGKVSPEGNYRVECFTRDPRPWDSITPGQTVKLRGVSQRSHYDYARLAFCEVLEVKGAPAPTYDADELARELAGKPAPQSGERKHHGQGIIISGQVDKVDSWKEPTVMRFGMRFKTGVEGFRVDVTFSPGLDEQLKTLKPGQTVRVVGTANSSGGYLHLENGVLLSAKGSPGPGGDPEKKPPVQQPAGPFAAPADVTLTADELGKEERKDEKDTRQKYKGKVIELTGVVWGMGRNIFLDPIITLHVKDEIVQLILISTEKKPWDKVSPGQRVKLKAIYKRHGDLSEPQLVGGPILEVSGAPMPTITAEQLAKAYEEDRKGADKKYGSISACALIVTGEITEAREGDPATSVPVFYLKTGSKLKLKCGPDRESARGLRPGMRVRIIGHCGGVGGFGVDPNDIRIDDCVVVAILKRTAD